MTQNYATIGTAIITNKEKAISKNSILFGILLSVSTMSFSQDFTKGRFNEGNVTANELSGSLTTTIRDGSEVALHTEHKTSVEANTWSYISNPFTFPISAEKFIEKNQNLIDATIYVPNTATNPKLDHNYAVGYSTFNLSGGTTSVGTFESNSRKINFDKNNAFGIIDARHAMLIQPTKSDEVVISNSMGTEAHRDDVMYAGKEPKARNRYWMNLTNANGNYSQTLMGYFKEATDDIDPGFDGNVFPGAHVTLYSFCNGIKLSIQGQAMPLTNDKYVVFGYNTKAAGMLSLYIPQTELDFNGTMPLLLKDGLLGGFHMIKNAPYYFYSPAGTFDERFEIHYTDGSNRLAGNADTMEDKQIIAYKEGNNIIVKSHNSLYTEIEIYDMNAKVVKAVRNVNTDFTVIDGVLQQNQLLLINIKTIEGKYITKKMIF